MPLLHPTTRLHSPSEGSCVDDLLEGRAGPCERRNMGRRMGPRSGGGRRPWTPAKLSGLLWLRADTGVTQAGSGVSDWLDKAGSGRKMTQTSDAARPQFNPSGIGGQPTVDGDGVNHYMVSAAALPALSAFTILSVQRFTANGSFRMLFCPDDTDFEIRKSSAGDKAQALYDTSSGVNFLEGNDSSLSKDEHWVYTYDSSTGGVEIFVDGSSEGSASDGDVSVTSAVAGLLARSDGSFTSEARLAELVYVPRAITEAERSKWNAYVAERYGI